MSRRLFVQSIARLGSDRSDLCNALFCGTLSPITTNATGAMQEINGLLPLGSQNLRHHGRCGFLHVVLCSRGNPQVGSPQRKPRRAVRCARGLCREGKRHLNTVMLPIYDLSHVKLNFLSGIKKRKWQMLHKMILNYKIF